MNIIKFIDIILILTLLVIGIDTFIKLNKSEGKKIEYVKKSLMPRINILMILTILVAITTIINIILNIK